MTSNKIISIGSTQQEPVEVRINPEFEKLIPKLKEEPKKILEGLLLKHGLQDSIKTWNGYIVDGHNRYHLCKKHGIPIRTTELSFEDKEQAMIWMIDNQSGRRDLEDYERCELEKNEASPQQADGVSFIFRSRLFLKNLVVDAKPDNLYSLGF